MKKPFKLKSPIPNNTIIAGINKNDLKKYDIPTLLIELPIGPIKIIRQIKITSFLNFLKFKTKYDIPDSNKIASNK